MMRHFPYSFTRSSEPSSAPISSSIPSECESAGRSNAPEGLMPQLFGSDCVFSIRVDAVMKKKRNRPPYLSETKQPNIYITTNYNAC